MAKALLKEGSLQCDDLPEDSDECTMEVIGRSIINNQNYQIQLMQNYLTALGEPATDDCEVEVATTLIDSDTSDIEFTEEYSTSEDIITAQTENISGVLSSQTAIPAVMVAIVAGAYSSFM